MSGDSSDKQLPMDLDKDRNGGHIEETTLVSKNDARDWDKLALVKRVLNFPSTVERYFIPRFYVDPSEEMRDQLILIHSNRVAVVCLAPSHPIVRERLLVENVDFKINESLDRLDNKVSGKWKKGGQRVKKDSSLCFIRAGDRVFTVRACVPGALVEVNSRLCGEPTLLNKDPFDTGFIGVVLPPFHLEHELRNSVFCHPNDYVEQRKEQIRSEFLR